MEEAYQHQRLDGRHQFRVLELQAAASRDDPLEFRLHRVAFDKHPNYAAISYTWDAQGFDQVASCDGRSFPISVNCDKILRELRPPFEYYSVYIWIDQICIDQSSQSDKVLNVSEMGAIYQQATSVLVWTGDFEKSTVEQLISVAEESGDIGSAPDTITEHWVSRYGLQRNKTLAGRRTVLEKVAVDHSCESRKRARTNLDVLHSFRSQFQNRRWFQRLWTFQEGIVPRSHRVYFLIGKYTVPLDILNDRNYGLAHEFYLMRSTNRDRDFADIVHTVRNRQCHDPRDRYFALYSVLRLLNMGSYIDFPEPDYSKRIKDVFIEAAYWAFRDRNDARFLYHAILSQTELNCTSSIATLPSWVPDLHRLSLLQRKTRNTFFPDTKMNYHAAPGSMAQFKVSAEPWFGMEILDVLELKGVVLDTIDFATIEIPEANMQIEDSDNWQLRMKKTLEQFLIRAFELGFFTKSTWISINNSFWKAVMHSTQSSALMPWQEQCLRYIFSEKASLIEETKQLARFRKLIQDETGNALPTINLSRGFWPPHSAQPSATRRPSQSFTTIFNEIEKHKIFLTRGHCIGVALGDVQKGDRIAVASGFCKTLVLRKAGDRWSLIGHGFVDGIMEGEMWPADETILENIALV